MATIRYESYLLKLWLRDEAPGANLLLLLENTQTGERVSFTELEALLTFLRQFTEGDSPPAGGDAPGSP